MRFLKSKFFWLIFLIFQIGFNQILKHFPAEVENYYSNGVFTQMSVGLRFVFGKIPFSVGDCGYFLLIVFVFRWIYLCYKNNKSRAGNIFFPIMKFLSIGYFLFHILWGYNYYRVPLATKMGLKVDFDHADLVVFTKKLISESNRIQFAITGNVNAKVVVPHSMGSLLQMGTSGYENLQKQHDYFAYRHPAIKASLFSKPLSYMGFGGYLNPFTIEAQVNDCLPKYVIPMTACHEMAHQIGFASESECNFIGFLAATNATDLYMQYSGYSFALRYCLAVLEREHVADFKSLYETINAGVLSNFAESESFWKRHESWVEQGFKVFYDRFLKVNNQGDGLQSYGRFLNLLINYDKQGFDRKITLVP